MASPTATRAGLAWCRRTVTVLRVWGIARSILLAALLAVLMHLVVGTYVSLPTFEDHVPVLVLVPTFATMLVAFPLVDQTPFLTASASRPAAQLAALRVAGVCAAGAVLFGALAGTPWSTREALMVWVLLAGCMVSAAVVGQWYWVPMTVVGLLWLKRFGISYDPRDREVEPWMALLLLGVAAGVYVWSPRHATDGCR